MRDRCNPHRGLEVPLPVGSNGIHVRPLGSRFQTGRIIQPRIMLRRLKEVPKLASPLTLESMALVL